MNKFKSFHRGVDSNAEVAVCKTAVEWANEWLEQNPDVEIIEFRHAVNNSGSDVICILYEEPKEIVLMSREYEPFGSTTLYRCPKCGYEKRYDGCMFLHDPSCPSCRKGGAS